MAPKVYLFFGSPVTRAVVVTAEALGITLEHHELDFVKGEHLSPEYHKLNPQHTAPTLDDDGFILWDSHAIIAYLVGKYGKDDSLYPKDLRKRAVIDQRLHFESGVLFPLLRTVDYAYLKKEIKEVPPRILQDILEAYDFLEKFLEGREWAAGDAVTIADFSLIPTVTSLDYHVKVDPEKYPNITAWIERALVLPCFASDHERLKSFVDFFDSIKV